MTYVNSSPGDRSALRTIIMLTAAIAIFALAAATTEAHAHGNEARMVDVLNWKQVKHIARVFGANRGHMEGFMTTTTVKPQVRSLEGQSCIVSELIGFDIENQYAFDIDESVELTLIFASAYTQPVSVAYDMSGGTGSGVFESFAIDRSEPLQSITLTLERARFAGQATQGADVVLGAPGGMALCDIKLKRSETTPVPTTFGTLSLTFKDAETGALVPARVGLYDSTGRAPLANTNSLMLQRFADDLRMLAVNDRTFWPSANRQAFYVDSHYEARLPVGTYELVATRGLEYRAYRATIEVKDNQETTHTALFTRYSDMPSEGWYSGDAHIHVTRDEVADPNIWGFVAAENVHVGNLLEMGNINKVYFVQPEAWGKASRFERDGHFIVTGQEAPRTGQMGHTIHLNGNNPVHLKTDEYFLYHKVFEEIARQGGISGFAHMGWNSPDPDGATGAVNRGLAMLAPFGLVDFIEVLQKGRLVTGGWYRMLNLGYRVSPAAGTDWPYSDFPGVVRNFTQVKGPFSIDAWFESFNSGKTFVTNGPLIEFTINGKTMGEEVKVAPGTKLKISAKARMNPDVDSLDRIELVVLGDVAETRSANGQDEVTLATEITVDRSQWIAVRAYGSKQDPLNVTIGHTSPIYIVVGDEPTWKREAVPTIVAEFRDRLQRLMTEPMDMATGENEAWETRQTVVDQWLLQKPLLRPRVDAADARYQELLERWSTYDGEARSTTTTAL